jgi:hypothetical protein
MRMSIKLKSEPKINEFRLLFSRFGFSLHDDTSWDDGRIKHMFSYECCNNDYNHPFFEAHYNRETRFLDVIHPGFCEVLNEWFTNLK